MRKKGDDVRSKWLLLPTWVVSNSLHRVQGPTPWSFGIYSRLFHFRRELPMYHTCNCSIEPEGDWIVRKCKLIKGGVIESVGKAYEYRDITFMFEGHHTFFSWYKGGTRVSLIWKTWTLINSPISSLNLGFADMPAFLHFSAGTYTCDIDLS